MAKRDPHRAFNRAFTKLRFSQALNEVVGVLTPADVLILAERGFLPKDRMLDIYRTLVDRGESGTFWVYYDRKTFKGHQLRGSREVL